MRYVRLTKTDGASQREIYVRRDSVSWLQGASPSAMPTPSEVQAGSSGAILHLSGAPGHTVTVLESVADVVRALEDD